VSAYALGIEPGTKLAARVRDGSLPDPSGDEAADRYQRADELLSAAGFSWYEISNWATSPQAQCRHNLLYWRNQHWWGVGPGAHSHIAGVRWSNLKDPEAWASAMLSNTAQVDEVEVLGPAARSLEQLMLGLRLAEGCPVEGLGADSVAQLVADRLAKVADGRLVLTLAGRLLADTVVRALAD
jgi:oxygen-independent coproporphyrinogen-3 oxidase